MRSCSVSAAQQRTHSTPGLRLARARDHLNPLASGPLRSNQGTFNAFAIGVYTTSDETGRKVSVVFDRICGKFQENRPLYTECSSLAGGAGGSQHHYWWSVQTNDLE
jgi:hypothetical protein